MRSRVFGIVAIAVVGAAMLACGSLVGCASGPSSSASASASASAPVSASDSGASGASSASAASTATASASASADSVSGSASSASASTSSSEPASSASSSSIAAASDASSFASEPVDVDDAAEIAAEEERLRQERTAAWRARFPLDDYANTLLIGDSLMQNASASLDEAMPGVTINADAGRTLETGGLVIDGESSDAGVLDWVRNDEGEYARYVIGTGNNDAGGMPIDAVEEIVSCLGPEKEIYFVTMCSLLNMDATDTTNQAIEDAVSRYPNVHKIDWYAYLDEREFDILRDGVHVYRDCEPDYAACIKEGLDIVY